MRNAIRESADFPLLAVCARRDIRRMDSPRKRLIVVGDRVLIAPEHGEERSRVGLYLPATAVDNQAVQGGRVVATGPGTPISAPTELDDEPWKIGGGEARFLPVQARVGDYAIFFRRAAVEITFEEEKYLVIPQAAILALVRESGAEPAEGW
jgi:chaperonin GroES